jgi:hypothetical protein
VLDWRTLWRADPTREPQYCETSEQKCITGDV